SIVSQNGRSPTRLCGGSCVTLWEDDRWESAMKHEGSAVRVTLTGKLTRRCGDCTLCCRLLPMKRDQYSRQEVTEAIVGLVQRGFARPSEFVGMMLEFDKPHGERCPHQCSKGCRVYARRPFGCRYWNCRWLVNDDCGDLRRPDRSHVVIDLMPDFVTLD